jgi:hypothetical protein
VQEKADIELKRALDLVKETLKKDLSCHLPPTPSLRSPTHASLMHVHRKIAAGSKRVRSRL